MANKKREDAKITNSFPIDSKLDYGFNKKTFKDGPIILVVNEDKTQISVYNFFDEAVSGALLSITDGKDDMPILDLGTIKSATVYVVSVPIERFASISKNMPKDKIQFRLVNLPKNYEDGKDNKSKNLFFNKPKVEDEKKEETKPVEEPKEEIKEEVKPEDKKVKKSFWTKIANFFSNHRNIIISLIGLIITIIIILGIIFSK